MADNEYTPPVIPTAADVAGECPPAEPVTIDGDITIGDIDIEELDVTASAGYQIEYCTEDCSRVTVFYCKDENHAGGQGNDSDDGDLSITVAGWVDSAAPGVINTGEPPAPSPDGCVDCDTVQSCTPMAEPGVCIILPDGELPVGFDPQNPLSWGDLCALTVTAVRWYDCDQELVGTSYNVPGVEDTTGAVEVLCPCPDTGGDTGAADCEIDPSYAEGLIAQTAAGPIAETFVFAEDICRACILNQTCCPLTVALDGVGTWIVPAGASVDIAPSCPYFTELAVTGECEKPGSITINGSRN